MIYENFDDLKVQDERFQMNSQNDAMVFAACSAFNTKIGQNIPVHPMREISRILVETQEISRPVKRSSFYLNIVAKFLF